MTMIMIITNIIAQYPRTKKAIIEWGGIQYFMSLMTIDEDNPCTSYVCNSDSLVMRERIALLMRLLVDENITI